ncbi:MAG: hypothetical protein ACXQS2_00065 [Methermicoccaceae archaeon]
MNILNLINNLSDEEITDAKKLIKKLNFKMLMRARGRGRIKRLRRLEGGAALWEVVK